MESRRSSYLLIAPSAAIFAVLFVAPRALPMCIGPVDPDTGLLTGSVKKGLGGPKPLEIEAALNTLPPRDAKVLRLYFGLEGGREHTLEEIGSMLGVTRERVRQLRDRALKRLREGEMGNALESFAA